MKCVDSHDSLAGLYGVPSLYVNFVVSSMTATRLPVSLMCPSSGSFSNCVPWQRWSPWQPTMRGNSRFSSFSSLILSSKCVSPPKTSLMWVYSILCSSSVSLYVPPLSDALHTYVHTYVRTYARTHAHTYTRVLWYVSITRKSLKNAGSRYDATLTRHIKQFDATATRCGSATPWQTPWQSLYNLWFFLQESHLQDVAAQMSLRNRCLCCNFDI